MATYLLDTSVIIDATNEKKSQRQLLRALLEEGHLLACCPINVAEVYAGMRPKEEKITTQLLRSLRYYSISFEIAELGGRLRREYGRKGSIISVTDALIAAVAIHNGLALITDNARHFRMKELVLFVMP